MASIVASYMALLLLTKEKDNRLQHRFIIGTYSEKETRF
jgi:hypothetical protein